MWYYNKRTRIPVKLNLYSIGCIYMILVGFVGFLSFYFLCFVGNLQTSFTTCILCLFWCENKFLFLTLTNDFCLSLIKVLILYVINYKTYSTLEYLKWLLCVKRVCLKLITLGQTYYTMLKKDKNVQNWKYIRTLAFARNTVWVFCDLYHSISDSTDVNFTYKFPDE